MLLEPVLQQCQHRPDALALRENGQDLTYFQLLQQAQAVAALLQVRGVQPGQPVCICLDRGAAAVIAILGVLLAGACYIPLDLKNPPARLAFIAEDARAVQVLGISTKPSWLDHELWLDIGACPPAKPLPAPIQAEMLAAILYTSGSTGQPRGVALSHAAIASFALWAAELAGLQDSDRIASSTPFFFDLSTFDLYAVLGRGASLHFLPAALSLAPAKLSAWLAEQSITGWYTVPSLLAFLAYKGNLPGTSLSSLRFVFFAGEVFPTPALRDLAAGLPDTALYNLFGPTETNVCCYWPVNREQLRSEQPIPIGAPATGCELELHDGELWVRGPTLASGYWNDGGLRPLLNPQGWYATGDRVSFRDGVYHFHGRIGRMLKCSGYRVEPAEIEAAVNAMPGVKACAVTGLPDPAAGQRPGMALVLDDTATAAEIRGALARRLPAYMQPKRCLVLPELPRLSNGKLDYRRLSDLLENPDE